MHIAGRLSLLPDDLKALVSRAMLATRHNDKLRLNIAYAYTGKTFKMIIYTYGSFAQGFIDSSQILHVISSSSSPGPYNMNTFYLFFINK